MRFEVIFSQQGTKPELQREEGTIVMADVNPNVSDQLALCPI